ncbi:MAG TPA: hypothetical protein VLN57_21090 [Xanthobacteraceae bacterium]|nr:hypothetical protein [Xanthobacteraceae bacterium]
MRYGRSVPDGFLPVFSVDTEEQARQLILLTCPRDAEGTHYARELAQEQTLENLQAFSDKCAKGWEMMQAAARRK